MIEIENRGPEIERTNYWQTLHAARGLCFLSVNAGTLRLLVPKGAEDMLAEMRTGKCATIEKSLHDARCWDVVFEDGSSSPFSLAVDKQQTDRVMTNGDCRLAVWTEQGKVLELACVIRV